MKIIWCKDDIDDLRNEEKLRILTKEILTFFFKMVSSFDLFLASQEKDNNSGATQSLCNFSYFISIVTKFSLSSFVEITKNYILCPRVS